MLSIHIAPFIYFNTLSFFPFSSQMMVLDSPLSVLFVVLFSGGTVVSVIVLILLFIMLLLYKKMNVFFLVQGHPVCPYKQPLKGCRRCSARNHINVFM